jgi:hypothetical protein
MQAGADKRQHWAKVRNCRGCFIHGKTESDFQECKSAKRDGRWAEDQESATDRSSISRTFPAREAGVKGFGRK